MPRSIAEASQLRVLPGESSGEWAPEGVLTSLTVHPFRPGETPALVTLQLSDRLRAVVERAGRETRLPCPLWLRIAVESARCVAEVTRITGWTAEAVKALCDRAATGQPRTRPVTPLAAATLGAYAVLLERGASAGSVESEGITVRLSDEIYGAWTTSAVRASRSLHRWVGDMVTAAPNGCVGYELAAARDSATLAEWIYAASLSAASAASSTA